MLLEELDNILSRIAESYTSEEIREIKKEYSKLAGSIFDDDRSFEARMACFLEWFYLLLLAPRKGVSPMSLPCVTPVAPIGYSEVYIRPEPVNGYILPRAYDKLRPGCFSGRTFTLCVHAQRQQSDIISNPVNWGQTLTA